MSIFEGALPGMGNQGNPIDVLNTLLDKEDIEVKTDLNISQIKVLTQLKWYELLNTPGNLDKEPMEMLNEVVLYYLALMVSLKRKSRQEIIDGISEMKESLLNNEMLFNQLQRK